MRLHTLLQLIVIVAISMPALVAVPLAVTPVVVDSADMQGYRRIWGTPSGCFYYLRRSSFEVRQIGTEKSLVQSLSGSQKLISSKKGRYFALITYSDFSPTSLRVLDIRLFSCDGQLIWTKRDPGCNSFILSDAYPVAVGIAGAEGLPDSRLAFFGADGEQIGAAKVENFSNGRFCESGEFFYAVSGGRGLVKFDRWGRELHHYGDCNRYFTSWDGGMIAVCRDRQLAIFKDSTEQFRRIIDDLSLREVEFSFDNRLAAVLMPSRLELVDLDSNRNVWEYPISDSNYQFFHFDSDSSFSYFVCGTNNSNDAPEIRNSRGAVMLLDSRGQLLWQEELTYGEWSVKYPEVRISLNPRVFTLLTAERLRIYSF